MPRKVHVNTASPEEKKAFKKRQNRYYGNTEAGRWICLLSLDESFFYYSLVRKVWYDKKKRPVVRVTVSHKHSCIFGTIGLGGKQLFRQYDKFNRDILYYLKKLHNKFPKCYLFMDKVSPPHYKSIVLKYFEENKGGLVPVYLPTTASPEFMVMVETWISPKEIYLF